MTTFWNRALVFVRILFLVRASIVVVAAMLLLAIAGGQSTFTASLFNFENDWHGQFLIALASELVALSVIVSANTVIHCGPYRFFALPPELFTGLADWAYWSIFLIGQTPAVVLFAIVWRATSGPVLSLLSAGVLGFAAGLAIALAAHVGQLWTSAPPLAEDPAKLAAEQPGLILGSIEQKALGPLFAYALAHQPPRNPLSPLVQWFYGVMSPFSAGYFRPMVRGNPDLHLRNSHIFSLWLAILSYLLYVVPGRMHENHLRDLAPSDMPSLFYVLMFLMLSSWVLAGLTFFLDRYRIPVLLIVIALSSFTGTTTQADHYFVVQQKTTPKFPSPQTVLGRFSEGGHVPILIATAGGGIQAAAWTTQVIDGMQDRFRIANLPVDFTHSVAAVSSVSGGSVGAMHFGFNLEHTSVAACEAKESSLDDVAWGWINPDVFRALAPYYRDKFVDRGWALERSLERVEKLRDQECPTKYPVETSACLSTWARQAQHHRFPAFLFNATVIDSGSPIIFATTTYPQPTHKGEDAETPTDTSLGSGFQEMFGKDRDLRLLTAVRLSASFPYVSPAARPTMATHKGDFPHIVDGGYYDNYGVFTLAHWLNDALERMTIGRTSSSPPMRILMLRIVPFPSDRLKRGLPEGWAYQLGAPLQAFLDVRSSAQQVESENALLRFREYWEYRANVQIQDVAIQYQSDVQGCEHPPVSWKLTSQQKLCVARDWSDSKNIQKAVNTVVGLIRTADQPDAKEWKVNR